MTQAFRDYLLSIVAISLLSSLLLTLVPKGNVHRTLSFLCGLAILLVTVGPVATVDFDDLARSISRFGMDADAQTQDVQTDNDELIAAIIKEKAETYILDKATSMGFSATAQVEVKTGEGYPYPYSARIGGHYSRQQKTRLEQDIEANLAIPSQRQEWYTDE